MCICIFQKKQHLCCKWFLFSALISSVGISGWCSMLVIMFIFLLPDMTTLLLKRSSRPSAMLVKFCESAAGPDHLHIQEDGDVEINDMEEFVRELAEEVAAEQEAAMIGVLNASDTWQWIPCMFAYSRVMWISVAGALNRVMVVVWLVLRLLARAMNKSAICSTGLTRLIITTQTSRRCGLLVW
ncbi:uncharacterized protein ASPGLDRAFT_1282264 [Aspergillus glaucus CBS 516.65]|uniref:Uncharacterized protein n=1 Tax=Aspergillus glaucus CBS 516.65 TaxID=1160497 RepID=A0A1L9V3P1_ASPGL|nr:hypothetical protein ASPGLDRAFT_1282264 [Aspergillus glaucus CBS 516.65]OJJ78449.1 hypothetical protein ASPGLDRAFT_1282264 [Aspergillus glaucus CBS 516.65]